MGLPLVHRGSACYPSGPSEVNTGVAGRPQGRRLEMYGLVGLVASTSVLARPVVRVL
jgi:hypothetical protein